FSGLAPPRTPTRIITPPACRSRLRPPPETAMFFQICSRVSGSSIRFALFLAASRITFAPFRSARRMAFLPRRSGSNFSLRSISASPRTSTSNCIALHHVQGQAVPASGGRDQLGVAGVAPAFRVFRPFGVLGSVLRPLPVVVPEPLVVVMQTAYRLRLLPARKEPSKRPLGSGRPLGDVGQHRRQDADAVHADAGHPDRVRQPVPDASHHLPALDLR